MATKSCPPGPFTGVVDGDDVRVDDVGRDLDLALEPLAEGLIARQVFGDHLDRFDPLQTEFQAR